MSDARDRLAREAVARGKYAPLNLDEGWPAVTGGFWPEDFSVTRDQIYDDAGRLTGGPQDQSEDCD